MLSSNSAARGHCYPSCIQALGHASGHPGGTCPGCVPSTVVGRVALTQGSSHRHSLLLTLLVLRTTLSFQLSETTGNSFPFLVSWSPKHADNPRACIHSVLPFSSTICVVRAVEARRLSCDLSPRIDPLHNLHCAITSSEISFFLFFFSRQGFCHNPKCRKVREDKLSPVVLSL